MEQNRIVNNFEDEEDEIDLVELFFELLRHIWFIVITTIVVAAITMAYNVLFVTPMYESTAELYMLDNTTSISSLADIQIGNNLADDYVAVTSSRPVLDTVIENLCLEEDYIELSNKLTVSNTNDTHILTISIKDANASRAKMIVDEIAKVDRSFIAEKMGQKEPSILHYGYSDGDKVSPHITRNTLIGAAGGFVFSAGLVVILYLLNNTIKGEDDVEKKLGLSVLGSIMYEPEIDMEKKKNRRGKK